jgi:hypothetical protein
MDSEKDRRMNNDYQLVQYLAENTKVQKELAESFKSLAEAVALQAAAIHALADSLAACTSEPMPEQEADPHAVDAGFDAKPAAYMDGTPIGTG